MLYLGHYCLFSKWFLKEKYDSISEIKNIKNNSMPKLFVHGDNDKIIPIRFGKKLFDVTDFPKDFVTMKGSGHNDVLDLGKVVIKFLETAKICR